MGIMDRLRSIIKLEYLDPLRQYLKMGEYKGGVLVGTDASGNSYYEIPNLPSQSSNNYRSRYVVYSKSNFDASQISAEWYGWLHYGFKEKGSINQKYYRNHKENCTGTSKRYVPYSTVKPKIINF